MHGISVGISMDSERRASLLSAFRSCILIPLILSLSLSPNPSSSSPIVSVDDSQEDQKVAVELYYETLCPYCSRFIVNHLVEIFDGGAISIADLKLIPYGNAKIQSNGTIVCQHGPAECLLNTVEACAINAWPALNEHFPFIYCIEQLVYQGKYSDWETCYAKLKLDSTPITKCFQSGLGEKLELQYAATTNALEPPHKYVPWVVVDGQPLYEDYENFISYICKAYKGTDVAEACGNALAGASQRRKETLSNRSDM